MNQNYLFIFHFRVFFYLGLVLVFFSNALFVISSFCFCCGFWFSISTEFPIRNSLPLVRWSQRRSSLRSLADMSIWTNTGSSCKMGALDVVFPLKSWSAHSCNFSFHADLLFLIPGRGNSMLRLNLCNNLSQCLISWL